MFERFYRTDDARTRASGGAGLGLAIAASLATAHGGELTVDTRPGRGAAFRLRRFVRDREPVLVLGTTDSTTITATEVIVQPPSSGGTSPGGQVVPYTKGTQGSSAQVGQIPSDYSQGSGTIVGGSTADQATEAALAAYPGGLVGRVVALGDGDYEVHYIGVNWPHHIFVNQDFRVIGADS